MHALNLFSVWMLSPTNCNKNLNISLSRLKCCNSWSSKCGNREIKDRDGIRGICILELKFLQIIHSNKLGIASNIVFFKSQLHFIDTEFSFPANSLNEFHLWCDTFTISNLHGMNKRHEETNYCVFDDNRKLKATKDCIFIHAKSGLKLLHSLLLRWWLSNVKCQTSNLVSDSNDQKLIVVPSLTYLEFLRPSSILSIVVLFR